MEFRAGRSGARSARHGRLSFICCSKASPSPTPTPTAAASSCTKATPPPGAIVVTSTADTGPGSLRAAVGAASPSAVIAFDPSLAGKTIALTSGSLAIDVTLAIAGTCPNVTIASSAAGALADDPSRLERRRNADRISRSTSTNGPALRAGASSTILIDASTITGSTAPACAAIDAGAAPAHVTLLSSSVTANASTGDGILCNVGELDLLSTTVANNTTGGYGTIYNSATGTTTVTQSVVNNNAAQNGGGVASLGGTVAATNATFYANKAGQSGGAVYVGPAGSASFDFVTVSADAAPDAQLASMTNGSLTLHNTLVTNAVSPAENDVSGAIGSLGYNVVTAPGTASGFIATDILKQSVPLFPFGNYSGPTNSVPPEKGAIVIDAADPGEGQCPNIDQRGVKRPQGPRCDIGAVEYRFSNPP